MKRTHRILAMVLACVMAFATVTTAMAATVTGATIDQSKRASLSLYKYDLTRAKAEGAWDPDAYTSTGVYDPAVNDVLGDGSINNQSSTNNFAYGYAVKGVEFTYLRIADVAAYSGHESNGDYKTMVQYGFEQNERSNALLAAIGLSRSDAYRSAGKVDYFTSDMLNRALSNALLNHITTTKNVLESFIKQNGGTAMPETDTYGHSQVKDLALGLYLVVETRVPNLVTSTCAPFFVSLPMTTIDGTEWNYDVTVYPKNTTGMPTLEKTVREAMADTGKNNGTTTDIADGYAHTATASDGDVLDYQVCSMLPTITSLATGLSYYTYVDTLPRGITYNKNDIVIQFYTDAACTDEITAWDEGSGKFTVSYDDAKGQMTIAMTEVGLKEMNMAETVYGTDGATHGYSDCTMRITYACTLHSDDSVLYGDAGNANQVQLTWKRSNTTYYDVLKDDCHVYTYGIDLLKQFSDDAGTLSHVQFKLHNDTDNYYVVAKLLDGIYYVTGHTEKETEATGLVPDNSGHIVIKGLEDDTYTATELKTDDGYTLLKNGIRIVITAKASDESCTCCHAQFLMASATVNGDAVQMADDHAIVPLTVVNTKGFTLPFTGSRGIGAFATLGIASITAAAILIIKTKKKNGKEDQ